MDEIGRRLRQAREAKGISLSVAEDDTKIRSKYLEALEAGREADLPGEAYTKGFLRTYGNYLELDGVALVEEYKERQLAKSAAREGAAADQTARQGARQDQPGAAPEHTARQSAKTVAPVQPPGLPQGGIRPRDDAEIRRRPQVSTGPVISGRAVGVTLGGLVLLGAILYLGSLIAGQFGGGGEPPGPDTPDPVTQTPPPQTTPPPAPPPQQPEEPKITMARGQGENVNFTVPPGSVQLVLEFGSARPWMQIREGGATGKVLHEGASRETTLRIEGVNLWVRMGHMNDVSLSVNGQRFEKPLAGGPYSLHFKSQ